MIIDTHGLLSITANDLLSHMIAVLGSTGSGKSNTVAVLAECLLTAGVPVCIVDTAGEYYGLKEKFDIWEIGRAIDREIDAIITPNQARTAARASYTKATSVILNLSGYDDAEDETIREQFVSSYMRELWKLAPHHKYPYVIILEEAHNYIPQRGKALCSRILIKIATEGRKQGLAVLMSSQRSARLNKDILTQAKLAFLHPVTHPADLDVYYALVPRPRQQVKQSVSRLKVGEALVLFKQDVQRRTIRLRSTPHYGHTPTIENIPKGNRIESAQEFVQATLFGLTITS